jgi:hypothetical protein
VAGNDETESKTTVPQRLAGPVKAIVLDANIFGGDVEPRMGEILKWSSACARNEAELWIPEVVCWEWAQRVTARDRDVVAGQEAHNRRLIQWGFEARPVPIPLDVEDVVEAIERAGAVVVRTTPAAALEGLRDQVLGIGAGSSKKLIKTGAADGSWVRSVIERNGGALEGVVIVTGDGAAIEGVCERVGIDSPAVVAYLHRLQHLLSPEPADAAQEETFSAAINGLLDEFASGTGSRTLQSLADMGSGFWFDPELPLEFTYEWEHQQSAVEALGGFALHGDIIFDAWSRSVTGAMSVPCAIEETYTRQDRWGGSVEYSIVNYEGTIKCHPIVFLDDEGNPLPIDDLGEVDLEVEQNSIDIVAGG